MKEGVAHPGRLPDRNGIGGAEASASPAAPTSILRNIVAERVLGMPPGCARRQGDVPFNQMSK